RGGGAREGGTLSEAGSIPSHEIPIFEDAGLPLLAFQDEVFGGSRGAGGPSPLGGGGKRGPPPPPQARRLHHLDDGLGPARLEGGGQRGIGAAPDRVPDVVRLHVSAAGGELTALMPEHIRDAGMGLEPPRRYCVEQRREAIGRRVRQVVKLALGR